MRRRHRALWRCPKCGRRFVNRNQWHSCRWVPLRQHFKGKGRHSRKLFEAFCAALRRVARSQRGPLRLVSSKTRIGFQARMTFADLLVRKDYLRGYLVLARPVRDNRFLQVQSLSPRNHIHHFRLERPAQIDRRLRQFLAEAYAVGQQKHLRQR